MAAPAPLLLSLPPSLPLSDDVVVVWKQLAVSDVSSVSITKPEETSRSLIGHTHARTRAAHAVSACAALLLIAFFFPLLSSSFHINGKSSNRHQTDPNSQN